jgi:hypothetical protein
MRCKKCLALFLVQTAASHCGLRVVLSGKQGGVHRMESLAGDCPASPPHPLHRVWFGTRKKNDELWGKRIADGRVLVRPKARRLPPPRLRGRKGSLCHTWGVWRRRAAGERGSVLVRAREVRFASARSADRRLCGQASQGPHAVSRRPRREELALGRRKRVAKSVHDAPPPPRGAHANSRLGTPSLRSFPPPPLPARCSRYQHAVAARVAGGDWRGDGRVGVGQVHIPPRVRLEKLVRLGPCSQMRSEW